MSDNPIRNPAQARTAEHYLEYLGVRLRHEKTPPEDVSKIEDQILELTADLADYNNNIALRLVVDNKA